MIGHLLVTKHTYTTIQYIHKRKRKPRPRPKQSCSVQHNSAYLHSSGRENNELAGQEEEQVRSAHGKVIRATGRGSNMYACRYWISFKHQKVNLAARLVAHFVVDKNSVYRPNYILEAGRVTSGGGVHEEGHLLVVLSCQRGCRLSQADQKIDEQACREREREMRRRVGVPNSGN